MRKWGRTKADYDPGAQKAYVHFVYQDLANCTVPMETVVYRPFNLDPTERFCLAGLAMTRGVKSIFEFGTYDGSTALLLARSVPTAEIVTLDLPPSDAHDPGSISEQQLTVAGGVGSKFHDAPESSRIRQLLGDSRTFDFGQFHGSMDLVLVDGGHSYECVRSDSENALRMLAPGGIVVWDDYGCWSSVARAVDDVARAHGISLIQLLPTELAVYDSKGLV
jgi:predicted O-methyltransferase YrrM